MIMLATRLRSERDGQRSRQAAQRLFGFSILYLFIVFAALLIEAGFSYHGP
jgi:protoheme IX farnesyltransferase